MSIKIFTEEQIGELLKNHHVDGCSERSIAYKKDFKILAVKKYLEGLPPNYIFREAGFNIALIGSKKPKWCLHRWRKIFTEKGEIGLETDSRKGNNPKGRSKGMADLTDKEKIKYLETKIAYLKAENDFLAKLRKKS